MNLKPGVLFIFAIFAPTKGGEMEGVASKRITTGTRLATKGFDTPEKQKEHRHRTCTAFAFTLRVPLLEDETMLEELITPAAFKRMDVASRLKTGTRKSEREELSSKSPSRRVNPRKVTEADERRYVLGVVCSMLLVLLVPALVAMVYLIVSPSAFTTSMVVPSLLP
ncbi:hypothetical protein [Rhodopirellula sp. P2]|uniref:hypothetical protein n=1 Tax=Rhodopirellula sp. P2 TaxID=2127060 RepID=UPI002368C60B|nr:hypothetical protein [Rhodopirellula sp. P2]WDQ15202.1 hypothetical protein PSR62_16320 [Rhodopirellula sp. P2]